MNFVAEDGVVFGHAWSTFCHSQNCEKVEGFCLNSARLQHR